MNVLLTNARKRSLKGLTLIELVVVLAILVALVGLVLAFFPGLLSKASKSTSASSIQDVARAVSINFTTSQTYGTGYDSLLTVGGTTYGSLTTAVQAQVLAATVAVGDDTALATLGLTSLRPLTATATDATFNVSGPAAPIVGGTSKALTITSAPVITSLLGNYTPGLVPTYYVVGVGKGASVVGTGQILQDAPVRAGANALENPTTSYQRYGLVFLVDTVSGARTGHFLGGVAFTATGIATAESNLQQYYGN